LCGADELDAVIAVTGGCEQKREVGEEAVWGKSGAISLPEDVPRHSTT
jgi:hypothetical protein